MGERHAQVLRRRRRGEVGPQQIADPFPTKRPAEHEESEQGANPGTSQLTTVDLELADAQTQWAEDVDGKGRLRCVREILAEPGSHGATRPIAVRGQPVELPTSR